MGHVDALTQVLTSKQEEARMEQSRLDAELGSGRGSMVGLVVEGGALTRLLRAEYPALASQLCDLCTSSKSVVCCRVSPLQKAQVRVIIGCMALLRPGREDGGWTTGTLGLGAVLTG